MDRLAEIRADAAAQLAEMREQIRELNDAAPHRRRADVDLPPIVIARSGPERVASYAAAARFRWDIRRPVPGAGSLSPEQRQWAETLKRAGQNWAVWRPRDLMSGGIGRQLADLAAIQETLFA